MLQGNTDEVFLEPFFLFGPGSHSGHLEKAGVYIFDDLADHTAFSGRSPAFKNHHDRQLLFFDLHLIACESFAGLFQLITQGIRFRRGLTRKFF